MTITLAWWVLPLALALAGPAIPCLFLKPQGDYDFGTPLIALAIFAACEAGAIGIVLGKWLS